MGSQPANTRRDAMKCRAVPRQWLDRLGLVALAVGCTVLAGCEKALSAQAAEVEERAMAESRVDQGTLCETRNWQRNVVERLCSPGQKIIFVPEPPEDPALADPMLPLYFVAVNCDMRHSVVQSSGGVVCVYRPVSP